MSRNAAKTKSFGTQCARVFSYEVGPLECLLLEIYYYYRNRFQNKEEPISREELNTVTLEELDKHLSSLEETVQDMNGHWKSLNSHRQQLLEHHYVLVLGSHLFRPG